MIVNDHSLEAVFVRTLNHAAGPPLVFVLRANCWISVHVNVIVFPFEVEQSRTRALTISIFGQVHGDKGDLLYFEAQKLFKEVFEKAIVLCI